MLCLRAQGLRAAGSVESARVLYAEGLKKTPADPALLNGLALLQLEDLHQPHEAMNSANRAAEAAGDAGRLAAECLDTLARAQLGLGFNAQTKLTLKRSIRAASTPTNHLHLAQTLLSEGDRRAARTELELAREQALWDGRDDLLPAIEKALAALPAEDTAAGTTRP